ncbi:MAG: efflux RND transporter periplasmic adaptor subunit [Planctomycetes bacterium]|nr:efflux RND transporter periplasmic adaptor subunit [Planctomycetota bacterium]
MLRKLVGLCLLVAAVAGCQRKVQKIVEPKTPEVIVAAPTEQVVTEYEKFTGRTKAVSTVEIHSRVTGYLDAVKFRDGTDVLAGAPLFEIDPRTFQATVDGALASVEQNKARLERLERHEERVTKLWQNRTITDQEYDQARFDRAEAAASLAAANATLKLAQQNLGFCIITSPLTGRISSRLVDPGDLVKADETPLVVIVSTHPIYAYFDIDERTALRLRRLILDGKLPVSADGKTHVNLALADEDDFSLEGTIDFFDNQIEAGTGTLRVRAVIENKDLLLAPGMFLRLRIPVTTPQQALLVHEESLGTDQGQRFLYVVNEKDEISYRRVQTGFLTAGMRVIQEGLEPGERVVVTGLQRVRPGVKVVPKWLDEKKAGLASKVAAPDTIAPAENTSEAKSEEGLGTRD